MNKCMDPTGEDGEKDTVTEEDNEELKTRERGCLACSKIRELLLRKD